MSIAPAPVAGSASAVVAAVAAALGAAPERAIDTLVIHCSATPSGKPLGVQASAARRVPPHEVIDAWHALRGFHRGAAARARWQPQLAAIGYHHVIDLDGTVFPGRHESEAGAHVAGHNATSLGVCLVGGAEPIGQYSVAQWLALSVLVRDVVDRLGVRVVLGHRDLSPDLDHNGSVEPNEWLKTCPGFSVREWLMHGMGVMLGHTLPEAEAEARRA